MKEFILMIGLAMIICVGYSQQGNKSGIQFTKKNSGFVKKQPDAKLTGKSVNENHVKSSAVVASPDESVRKNEAMKSYPKYQDTGNAKKDNEDYQAAKATWIAAHPAEYAKLTGKKDDKKSKQKN